MIVRRRTVCVYCGRRIPGAVQRGDEATSEQRFAARLACTEHYYLIAIDPHYDGAMERSFHRCEPRG